MVYGIFSTILGNITIARNGQKICYLQFGTEELKGTLDINDSILKDVHQQIMEYLEQKRKEFQVDLEISGSDFERKVYEAVLSIPYGQTKSYKEIASRIGNSNASIAVGGAVGRNKILVLIPCHRVIGSNGNLTGYAKGLDKKKFLLEIEK